MSARTIAIGEISAAIMLAAAAMFSPASAGGIGGGNGAPNSATSNTTSSADKSSDDFVLPPAPPLGEQRMCPEPGTIIIPSTGGKLTFQDDSYGWNCHYKNADGEDRIRIGILFYAGNRDLVKAGEKVLPEIYPLAVGKEGYGDNPFNGRIINSVEAKVVGKEAITVKAGTYNTYEVRLILKDYAPDKTVSYSSVDTYWISDIGYPVRVEHQQTSGLPDNNGSGWEAVSIIPPPHSPDSSSARPILSSRKLAYLP